VVWLKAWALSSSSSTIKKKGLSQLYKELLWLLFCFQRQSLKYKVIFNPKLPLLVYPSEHLLNFLLLGYWGEKSYVFAFGE
jgi:hypothetical protein